jgi:hypothetical protein
VASVKSEKTGHGRVVETNSLCPHINSLTKGKIMPTSKTATTVSGLLAAWLIGTAAFCALAGAADYDNHQKDLTTLKQDFKKLDKNGDGYLSMQEFKAAGKDDLAFKAADADGDGRIDMDEYVSHIEAKAADKDMQKQ